VEREEISGENKKKTVENDIPGPCQGNHPLLSSAFQQKEKKFANRGLLK